MTLAAALRASEVLMALAFLQQSLEHLAGIRYDRTLSLLRTALAAALLAGLWPVVIEGLLVVTTVAQLVRFHGPYNGGSDRMGLLLLLCLFLVRLAPTQPWREVAMGYLAIQVTLSYAIAGWVKVANPDWRRGQALRDVFAFSTYPVSESLRGWARHAGLWRALSWLVMLFEIGFPLTLLHRGSLMGALVAAALFHVGNASVFGLNRFVWIWVAAYPSLLWFHARFLAG